MGLPTIQMIFTNVDYYDPTDAEPVPRFDGHEKAEKDNTLYKQKLLELSK